MNREEVIRLAREAGAGEPESLYGRTDYVVMTWFELERFAALVAAAEREKWPNLDPVINWLENGCDPKEAAKELRLYAAAIRARGESK
jgi:hypothetical protein